MVYFERAICPDGLQPARMMVSTQVDLPSYSQTCIQFVRLALCGARSSPVWYIMLLYHERATDKEILSMDFDGYVGLLWPEHPESKTHISS